ncbi:type II secretion system F family protein [Patescibacteria group bacterium]|nr:type II secretion system F family protein [Patescibacteria group bacterium]
MSEKEDLTKRIEKGISLEKQALYQIFSLYNTLRNIRDPRERRRILLQIESLKRKMVFFSKKIIQILESDPDLNPGKARVAPIQDIESFFEFSDQNLDPRTLNPPLASIAENQDNLDKNKKKKLKSKGLEKLTIKSRKNKDKKKTKKKTKRPSSFVKISSRMFHNFSMSLIKQGSFRNLKRDIVKSNLEFVPATYLSLIFFSTIIAAIIAFFVTGFFLFFDILIDPPFIAPIQESFIQRLPKVIWVLFALPLITFVFAYFFPSMERQSLERKINHELPFATVHMSSIAGSMVEPSKIFGIIASTGEYPNLEKEFIKLQNEINIYGYDLVTALRNRVFNSPSRKLADLFNGLSTTITSGGDLAVFFEKRAQSLLFEYRLDIEKQGKAAETFMDIYISLVVAAPMILMLLLMMMGISGLGISLSPSMISIIMILSISGINALFLAFLHLKQSNS